MSSFIWVVIFQVDAQAAHLCEKMNYLNRARGPCEKIFVTIFNVYGPNAVRSMRLECQNKYFPYGPKSRLIRALLYTYPIKQ